MVIRKVREHLIPRPGNIILLTLNEFGFAQEAARPRGARLPFEMGEDVGLEETYVGE